jgi:hypothetical protein
MHKGVEKTTYRVTSCSVLFNKYYSGDQIKKNEMGRTCSTYGGEKRCIHDFGKKTGGKEPLGKPRRGWEDNIIIDLREMGCGCMTESICLRIGTGGGLL